MKTLFSFGVYKTGQDGPGILPLASAAWYLYEIQEKKSQCACVCRGGQTLFSSSVVKIGRSCDLASGKCSAVDKRNLRDALYDFNTRRGVAAPGRLER